VTATRTYPAPSQQAAVDAALLVLKSMGLSPEDLTSATTQRLPLPTFAEYVPVVSAAVTDGTRRAYGTYWNRIGAGNRSWQTIGAGRSELAELEYAAFWMQTNGTAHEGRRGSSQYRLYVGGQRCACERRLLYCAAVPHLFTNGTDPVGIRDFPPFRLEIALGIGNASRSPTLSLASRHAR
jgi:integrase/recombinase XerC